MTPTRAWEAASARTPSTTSAASRVSGWAKRTTTTTPWSLTPRATGPSTSAVKWWMTATSAMSRSGRLSMPTAARTIPAASSPWRKASSTAPLTATLTTAKGWSTSGMRTAAVSPRMTSPIPRRTRCPTGTAVWTETRTPIGAGIPTSASEMSRNLRAFGTMTAISRLRPISSSTVMETGAITSALPALSLRKWTAEFSPTPWMR